MKKKSKGKVTTGTKKHTKRHVSIPVKKKKEPSEIVTEKKEDHLLTTQSTGKEKENTIESTTQHQNIQMATNNAKTETPAFSLDSVMEQYSAPAVGSFPGFSAGNPNPVVSINPGGNNVPVIAPNASPAPNDKSDPKRYYQSGKRKGQERPSWKQEQQKNPNPVNNPSTPTSVAAPVQSKLITGKMFMLFINFVMPFIIGGLHNMLSKQIKVDVTKLKLSDEQNKELEPVAEEVVKYLNITMNPVLMFGVMYGGCISMNITLQRAEAKRKLQEQKNGIL